MPRFVVYDQKNPDTILGCYESTERDFLGF